MIAPTPEVRKSVPPPTRLIFHDFDYINPTTNLPEGDTIENVQLRNQMLMQTASYKMFGSGSELGSSPGMKKSLYVPSGDAGSEKAFF